MLDQQLRVRDIVEVVHDINGAPAGTQGVVLFDWTDGHYEVATRACPVPVTAAAGDLALLARPHDHFLRNGRRVN